ncbi:MAG: hypothetical protein ACJ70V_03960, partial [Nitrososphaera sp.]
MPIPQSKRKLIAATALFIAVGTLTGAIATGGAATLSYATTQGQADGGSSTGQQGGQQGRVIQQGTVTSSPVPLPGREEEQRAEILPLTPNGTVYSGVLTFTATEPVDLAVLNVLNLNATERALLNNTEDDGATLPIVQLDNQTWISISSITPAGDSPSASIPFAGNAIWLHSPEGTPFAASYAVSAQVLPAENVNEISNMTAATTDGGAADEDGGGDGGGAVDEAATAATATDGGGGDGGGDGGDEAATAATATNANATD